MKKLLLLMLTLLSLSCFATSTAELQLSAEENKIDDEILRNADIEGIIEQGDYSSLELEIL